MKKKYRIAPDVREQVLKRIREEGISVPQAAKDAGISDAAIYRWLGRGAEGARYRITQFRWRSEGA